MIQNNKVVSSGSSPSGLATVKGAGLYCGPETLVINNVICGNEAIADLGWHNYVIPPALPIDTSALGGGLYIENGIVSNNVIYSNVALAKGNNNASYNSWMCDAYEGRGGNATAKGAGVFAINSVLSNNTISNCNLTSQGGRGVKAVYFGPNWYDFTCEPWNGDSITEGGGVYSDSASNISNTIIWANLPNQLGGHNCVNVNYCDIGDGTCAGLNGNISVDPLFADPANGVFHLKSQYGRWSPASQSWVTDTVTSPCIDAGDPADPNWKNELWPHGKRINMGAYGGTPESSMSSSMNGNIADVNYDNYVDLLDFSLFASCWNDEATLLPEDMSRNNHVDLEDLCIFAENWLQIIFEPVGYWKFNETGPTVYDSSLLKNHGMMKGSVYQDNNGTGTFEFFYNGYVEIPDSNLFTFENGITVSVWVILGSYGESWGFPKVVIKPYDVPDTDPWELYCLDLGPHGTYPRFILSAGNPGSWVGVYDSSKILSLNQWHHLVGTYNGTTMSLYVDGQLFAATATNVRIGDNTQPLCIGSVLGNYGFNGYIDEVRLFNYGMDSNQVQTLYSEGANEFVLNIKVREGHGTVTEYGSYHFYGNHIELTAVPDIGWEVKRWVGTDDDFNTSNTNTVTMTSDKIVMIDFKTVGN